MFNTSRSAEADLPERKAVTNVEVNVPTFWSKSP